MLVDFGFFLVLLFLFVPYTLAVIFQKSPQKFYHVSNFYLFLTDYT